MNLDFGLNPDDYDFASAGDASYDPNESFLDKARRALAAREAVAGGMSREAAPEPITVPRVQNQAENPTFFQKHPGGAKAFDIASATLALIANQRNIKKNNAAGRYGPQTKLIDLGSMPSITGQVQKKNAAQNLNEQGIQEKNSRIAEAEARINESAMNRWAGRRTAELGQMVPSITRAAMREPRAERAPAVYKQKLETLKQSQAYLDASPKDRTAMELHVIGAEPKTSEDVASAYNKAFTRLQAKLDFQQKHPGAAGGKDIAEIDLADMSKYMAGLIHDDYVEPEKAADMALEFGRNKMKLREAMKGKESTMRPGVGAVGGRPASPAGADQGVIPGATPPPTGAVPAAPASSLLSGQVRAKSAPGLPPDLQSKLAIYAAQINKHPERRAQLREDLMRTYGLDPDLYIEPGP